MGFLLEGLKQKQTGPSVESQIAGAEARLKAIGAKPPEEKPGFLARALDLFQRGNYAAASLAKELIEPGDEFEPLQEAWKGLKGEQKTTFKDVAETAGVSTEPLFEREVNLGSLSLPIAPSPASIAGLAGDIFLDPLTYLTVGQGGLMKGGLKLSTKGAPLLSKLPEAAVSIPGTAAAARAINKALGITEKAAAFSKGFQKAARGFAPAGEAIKVVKQVEKPVGEVTEKALIPKVAEALKVPQIAAEVVPEGAAAVETSLRQVYQAISSQKKPLISAATKGVTGKKVAGLVLGAFPEQQFSEIAETLGKTSSELLKDIQYAASRGISEDSFVRAMMKAAAPTAEAGKGWLSKTIRKPVMGLIDEVTEVSPPLLGAEKLGYRIGSNKIVQAFGEAFSSRFGLHPRITEARKTMQRAIRLDQEEILNRARNYIQIVPEASAREAMAKYLDDPKNNPVPRGLEQIADLIKQRFTKIGEREKELGVLDDLWDNYVTHIYKDSPEKVRAVLNRWAKSQKRTISTMHGFAKERVLPTFAEAEKLGLHPEYDVAKIMAIRDLAHSRVTRGVELINQLKQMPFLVTEASKAPADFVKVTGVKGLENMAVAPDVGKFLTKMQNVFGDNEAMNGFMRAYDKYLGLWKSYATVANLGHNFRNMFGNFFNNWLADVDGGMYGVAARIQKGAKGKIGDYTFDQIRQLARKEGVIGTGFFSGELRKFIEEDVSQLGRKAQLLNPLTTEFAPVKYGRMLGSSIEENARLAHFVDRLGKGIKPTEAAASVMKYLFDYNELSQFEKEFMRRLVPFYTWLRKNIPLQLETMLLKPGKYATVGKVQRAVEEAAGGPISPMPDWLKEAGGITTPIVGEQGRLSLLPRLPYEDIGKLAPDRFLREAVSGLTPALQVPFELGANIESYTGRPIEEFKGEKVPFGTGKVPAKVAYLLRQIPMVQNLERLVQEGRADVRLLDLLASMAGIRMYPEETVTKSGKYDQLKRLQDYIKYLEQEGKTVPTLTELKKKKK